ncbi:LPXTG cell wall anchor domain-containing protein [Tumebacillus permanentifrigoris]|uniref:LPXTG-motif cell wall-anchored protein n=1 Tax=Tumebacillus permanentifrigoris TaxID=378543 RepID=A0A316D447_9BACL|nr:LPXTG cell wall anchor domain-containing protein [Tumebacillus permanentifrigoris]PWK06311.1 LPXTG-motif cell wall-anchored protein [Tumebacillus permanentifrigoris]
MSDYLATATKWIVAFLIIFLLLMLLLFTFFFKKKNEATPTTPRTYSYR